MRLPSLLALLTGLLLNAPHPTANPTTAPITGSGVVSITWTGFDQKTDLLTTSSTGADGFVLTLPSMFPPVNGASDQMYYKEQIKVLPEYGPKAPFGPVDLNGPWFVERRALAVVGGKETVLRAMRLSIGKTLIAFNAESDTWIVPKGTTHLDYRVGRRVTTVGPGKSGPGLPKGNVKNVIQYNPKTVRVKVAATLCEVDVKRFRPLPCEFRSVKLEILGKNGQVLFTVLPNDNKPIVLPNGQAKSVTDNNIVTYGAKWTVRRINHPVFFPDKGYMVSWGNTTSDFAEEVDNHGSLAKELDLSGPVGKEFTIPFDIHKALNSGSTIHQVLIQNDVTKTKFKPGITGSIRAEVVINLNW